MTEDSELAAIELVVTTEGDVGVAERARIVPRIEATLRDHLAQAKVDGFNFFEVRLRISVDRFLLNDETARVRIGLQGNINGITIERSFKRTRHLHPAEYGAHSLVGFIAFAGGLIIEWALRRIAGHRIVEDQLDECLTECLADMCIMLDAIAWRPDSSLVSRWRTLQRIRWWVAAMSFAGEAHAYHVASAKATVAQSVSLGCIAAAFAFFVVHAISILLMPAAFFHSEARGRKAMARSGARSVLGLRVVATLIALVFAGLLGLTVLLSLVA